MMSLGLLLAFALGLAVEQESQEVGQVENRLEGEILLVREIFPLSLTLRDRGQERSIELDPSTKVLVNGQQAAPGRLAPGQYVRINIATIAGRPVVRRVEVLREVANDKMHSEPKRSRQPTESSPAARDADRETSSVSSDVRIPDDRPVKPTAEGGMEPILVMPELELSPEQIEVGPAEHLGEGEYQQLQKLPPIEEYVWGHRSSDPDPAP